jgi:hypothetical protein
MTYPTRKINETLRQQFFIDWNTLYPQTPPIAYLFKQRLANRWARIHSLPKSKRYAETKEERAEILRRQNTIIHQLIGKDTEIRVVSLWMNDDNPLFTMRQMDRLGMIALAEHETEYDLYTYVTDWEPPDDILLTMIADDAMRAFLIGPDCLIAPYDGGMDVILKDPYTTWEFKRKYKDWLSPREDGL